MHTVMLDVDGVLLDWDLGLKTYMSELGFKIPNAWHMKVVHRDEWIKQFNLEPEVYHVYVEGFCRSLQIERLQPNYDAVKQVNRLRENGWRMIICTMLGTNKLQQEARVRNLKSVFGDVFEAYHFLDYRDFREMDEDQQSAYVTKAKLMDSIYGNRIDVIVDDSASIINQFAAHPNNFAQRCLFHNKHDVRGEPECRKHRVITSLGQLLD